MKYLSCFSGIGGLEGAEAPALFCESDEACVRVLSTRYPEATVHDDIRTLKPPKVDLVAGGWPCQDISVAGKQVGLSGDRSGLLSELLRVAQESRAGTVVAENVANLLTMRGGSEFGCSLRLFHGAGFPFVAWRLLNAREFGLPQHRTRLIIIASKRQPTAESLFRDTPVLPEHAVDEQKKSMAAGFYWTAGTHSINYSRGYVPTLKIGSGLSIPSPPAVHFGNTVRTLTAIESLRLQGFTEVFSGIKHSDMHRMAGNAVPRPMGVWVFAGIENETELTHRPQSASTQMSMFESHDSRYSNTGISVCGDVDNLRPDRSPKRATNLIDFLDVTDQSTLSPRAAAGLLNRLGKSGQLCPAELHQILVQYSTDLECLSDDKKTTLDPGRNTGAIGYLF